MQDDVRNTLYGRYVSTFKGKGKSEVVDSNAFEFEWWDHKYLPLLNGLEPDARVLEIGCGAGRLLEYLGRRGFSHASGIDISAEQVSLARRRGVDVTCGDAFDHLHLGASTQRFEAIIAVDVLEHFTRAEAVRMAGLVRQALGPHGRLIVQTANGAGLFPGQVIYGDLTHQTIFTPGSLAQLLHGAGFEQLSFYETGPIPIRLRGKLDLALWTALKRLASAVRYVETGKRQTIWTENFICRAFTPG